MKKRIKYVTAGIYMILILGLFSNLSYAEEKGTITVDFSIENHTNPIEGAEFVTVKILDYVNGQYIWNEALRNRKVDMTEILTFSEEAAKKLMKDLPDQSQGKITDENGRVVFANLEDGIWLIYQKERTGEAKKYHMAGPALVPLPGGEHGVSRNITVYPKTTRITDTTIETVVFPESEQAASVKTGDAEKYKQWLWLMLGAIVCIGICDLLVRRAKK